jgi:hypothetical protein
MTTSYLHPAYILQHTSYNIFQLTLQMHHQKEAKGAAFEFSESSIFQSGQRLLLCSLNPMPEG